MMEWMVVQLSLEEQLALEGQSRLALNCPDSKEVAKLCSTLIKQNAHQAKLIKQAVHHIAALEATLYLQQSNRPWWRRVI
jgi:hypothetical protein